MNALPPPDLSTLDGFPGVELYDVPLFRIHRLDRGMVRFSTSGTWRFDPPPGDEEYGVCYAAGEPVAAVIETLARVLPVRYADIARRSLAVLDLSRPLVLADFTDPTVLGLFGLTAEISIGADYTVPQVWSAALRRAGFDGIRYVSRHDPTCDSTSFAIFSPRSGDIEDIFDGKSQSYPLDADRIAQDLLATFGIRVRADGHDSHGPSGIGVRFEKRLPIASAVSTYLHDSIEEFPDPFLRPPPDPAAG